MSTDAASRKLSGDKWFTIIVFSLLGQIAWCIENQFLNFYMDRTISANAFAISFMVAASAIVATLTTLIVGIRIDKVGKRVPYMTWGYFIWGFTIMAFSLVTVNNMKTVFHVNNTSAVNMAIAGIVILDCVMTFFGSTANDAAFNAWVTDNTTTNTRGKVEAILAIMASIAAAIIYGWDFLSRITQNKYYNAAGKEVSEMVKGGTVVHGNWTLFFCVFGGVVLVFGILGKFYLKDSKDLKPNPESTYRNILYGFKPSIIKKNKIFYLCLAAMVLNGIASNVTGPYFLIYIQRTLGITNYAVPFAIIYGTSGAMSIAIGFWLDRAGRKERFLPAAVIAIALGNAMMFIVSPSFFKNGVPVWLFCISAFINSCGAYTLGIILSSTLRDYTPKQNVGQFQGVRMVFNVMIPMCVGPFVTAFMNKKINTVSGLDEYGKAIYNYHPLMFLIAGILSLAALIPIIYIIKARKKEYAAADSETSGTAEIQK